MEPGLWDRPTFAERLREVGTRSYHHKHPFHVLMNEGKLGPDAIRTWVANRFYYQQNISIKDAAIISNCPVPEVRRGWLHRIIDHDGTREGEGGIEAWLKLGGACGIPRSELLEERHLLPGVRFAVDAYVNFARTKPWPVAVASSLTELFAPEIHKQRLANWPDHYPWIDPAGLHYFQSRVSLARRDVEFGLAFTLDHFDTRALQERAIEILKFKLDVLWQMSDAMALRYMTPGGAIQ